MPRLISFIVLLAIVLLVGAIFFQVMAQFFVPLFLACVLLVMFKPLHQQLQRQMPKHPRFAAMFTTIIILLAVLLPLTLLGWKAYVEMHAMFAPTDRPAIATDAKGPSSVPPTSNESAAAPGTADAPGNIAFLQNIRIAAHELRDKLNVWSGVYVKDDTIIQYEKSAVAFLTSKALSGLQSAVGILVGLAIMVIALYYFLADGPAMIETILDLSPLDARYEQELLTRFGDVSRAVVVATLLSALVQGALAGLGYAIALPPGAPVFLLTALTMTTALVPFVGAAAMWISVCGWIYLYGEHMVNGHVIQGDPKTAIILAIYCTIVVSGIDNVIKPFILHGQSKLHPLLALLSILGGVQVLGPVGILVGPMLVSFLQALLEMLRKELDSFSGPVVDGTPPLAVATSAAAPQVSTENVGISSPASPALQSPNTPGGSQATARSAMRRAFGRRSKRKK